MLLLTVLTTFISGHGSDFSHGVLVAGRYVLWWWLTSCSYILATNFGGVLFVLQFAKYDILIYFFPSIFAISKQVSLSTRAEQVLEEKIKEETKGDVIYFWAHFGMDSGLSGSNDALTFWSMCDILNGGNCRYVSVYLTMICGCKSC